jgi:hypothetical protein
MNLISMIENRSVFYTKSIFYYQIYILFQEKKMPVIAKQN